MSEFPKRRMRRLRRTPALRGLVRETGLSKEHLIQPVFVVERNSDAGPIGSMPGVSRFTLDGLDGEVDEIAALGLPGVLLFGLPAQKDADATRGTGSGSVVCEAIKRIRARQPGLVVITDVCLCSYTPHGHCGVVVNEKVDNDATLEAIGAMALHHASAGADLVAPSGMMDGMVAAIRHTLEQGRCAETGILSYAVKYASSFYGPFREAADSTPMFGDRRGYQMDPANVREALAEARLDVQEGADMLMVKPAMPYLDVLRHLRDELPEVPFAAYQVSGEYGMLKAAAERGWLDERAAVMESLTAIRRAGADVIITYFAKEVAGRTG